jgi:hypothetical protein
MVKRPMSCHRDHFLFQLLDPSYVWTVEFYKLVESARPIGAFSPAEQSIVPLDGGGGAIEFWPCKPRGAKPKVCASLPPRAALHAIEDADEPDGDSNNGSASAEGSHEGSSHPDTFDSEEESAPSRDGSGSDNHSFHSSDFDFGDVGGAGGVDHLGGLVPDHGPGGVEQVLGPPAMPPPPLPPPAAFEAAPSEQSAGSKQPPEAVVPYCRGTISFYRTTMRFEVKCNHPQHGTRCRLSRIATASALGTNPAQGRPVGLAGAWLACAGEFASQREHISREGLALITHEMRSQHISALPGAERLFAGEVRRRAIDREEPLRCP